jgi:hypothetical protein
MRVTRVGAVVLLVLALAPVTQAAQRPGYITVEQGSTCDTTIVRFTVRAGVDADVTVTSSTLGTVFDEHVDTTARTQPLEILSISGLLGAGTVVMTIDQFRFREKLPEAWC